MINLITRIDGPIYCAYYCKNLYAHRTDAQFTKAQMKALIRDILVPETLCDQAAT